MPVDLRQDEEQEPHYRRLHNGSQTSLVLDFLNSFDDAEPQSPAVIGRAVGLTTHVAANACGRLWRTGRISRVRDPKYRNRSKYAALSD